MEIQQMNEVMKKAFFPGQIASYQLSVSFKWYWQWCVQHILHQNIDGTKKERCCPQCGEITLKLFDKLSRLRGCEKIHWQGMKLNHSPLTTIKFTFSFFFIFPQKVFSFLCRLRCYGFWVRFVWTLYCWIKWFALRWTHGTPIFFHFILALARHNYH